MNKINNINNSSTQLGRIASDNVQLNEFNACHSSINVVDADTQLDNLLHYFDNMSLENRKPEQRFVTKPTRTIDSFEHTASRETTESAMKTSRDYSQNLMQTVQEAAVHKDVQMLNLKRTREDVQNDSSQPDKKRFADYSMISSQQLPATSELYPNKRHFDPSEILSQHREEPCVKRHANFSSVNQSLWHRTEFDVLARKHEDCVACTRNENGCILSFSKKDISDCKIQEILEEFCWYKITELHFSKSFDSIRLELTKHLNALKRICFTDCSGKKHSINPANYLTGISDENHVHYLIIQTKAFE